jgi:poly(3-hydroxybutyrate) depolymerase
MVLSGVKVIVAAGLMMLSGRGVLAGPAATRPARTGAFPAVFTERSPLSTTAEITRRLRIGQEVARRAEGEKDYSVGKESFEVYVPKEYTGEKPYGLFVWISPGAQAGIRPEWHEVLDKHQLIWVGPNGAGNDRAVLVRMGLAVDAVHNMKKGYAIDQKRIYVGGMSGGGRVANIAAVAYADLFAGGFYMCGASFYRDVAAPGEQGKLWRRQFAPPLPTMLTQAKKRNHVLLTGEKDGNRTQTQVYAQSYQRDGFEHVTYLEAPGLGHEMPDAQWFERGIVALEGGGNAPDQRR